MTDRKFYKTIVQLEVLSERPIGDMDVEQIAFEATEGDFSMRRLPDQETVLNGKETADALGEQGSNSMFFQLTDDGDDLE